MSSQPTVPKGQASATIEARVKAEREEAEQSRLLMFWFIRNLSILMGIAVLLALFVDKAWGILVLMDLALCAYALIRVRQSRHRVSNTKRADDPELASWKDRLNVVAEEDWGPEFQRPDKKTVYAASNLLYRAFTYGKERPGIYIGENGSIEIEWGGTDKVVTITAKPGGVFDVFCLNVNTQESIQGEDRLWDATWNFIYVNAPTRQGFVDKSIYAK